MAEQIFLFEVVEGIANEKVEGFDVLVALVFDKEFGDGVCACCIMVWAFG